VALKIAHGILFVALIAGLVWASVGLLAASPAGTAKEVKVLPVKGGKAAPRSGALDNQGGPDSYGYRYVDNVSPDTATYQWIELRGDPQTEWLDFSSEPDDGVLHTAIGFDFPFYGVLYDSVVVSTNGNLQFETADAAFSNECLPAVEIDGPMICVYWDDLNLESGGYPAGDTSTVGVRRFADRCVVEWDSVGIYNHLGSSFKFEAILYADGRIKVQYNNMVFGSAANSQTIGVQSRTTGPALEYVCNAVGHQPANGCAVWFHLGPTGTITGTVRNQFNSPIYGATVTLEEAGRTTVADVNGDYSFPTVAVGSYMLTASRAHHAPQQISNVVVNYLQTTTVNFQLAWDGVVIYVSYNVPMPIADNDTTLSTLTVDGSAVINDLDLCLNLLHTWDEDLHISLIGPGGQTVLLSNRRGGSGDNYINTVFDDEAQQSITEGQPPFTGSFRPEGLLATFDGTNVHGTWTLQIIDMQGGDVGELLSWEMYVVQTGASDQPGTAALAGAFGLLGNYPNPFNSRTEIRYAVPSLRPLTVKVYNVLGQDVRTLVQGLSQPGTYTVAWDGRNSQGMDVPSGLYLVRMESAGRNSTGKMILMR
jgi:subtilisin-like proprotein convertase family protein